MLHAVARRGYTVIVAMDGAQCVAMAQSESPDLILMDMNFGDPRRLGGNASNQGRPHPCQASRDRPHRACDERRSRKVLAAGCDNYRTKPVELARLLTQIEAALRRTASA